LESEEEASFQSTQADFAKLVDDDVWVVWVGPGMMEELMERGVRAVRRNWGLRGGGGGGGRDSKGEE